MKQIIIATFLISCMPIKSMDKTPEQKSLELVQRTRECHRTIVELTGGGLFGIKAYEQRKKAQEQANRDRRNTCIAYAVDIAVIGVLAAAVIYYYR